MSVYRLTPPRKFKWWFRTTANNDWYLGNAAATPPPPPPIVESVIVNDGHAQRSKVNRMTVTFDSGVVLDSNAITLTGRDGAGTGTVLASANPSGDQRTWVLRFSGTPIIGGSVADGIYDLRVLGARVHTGSASGPTMAEDHVFEFHRLLSDSDGDGDSDNTDMFRIRATYGKASDDPAYLWYFDYTADGDVDSSDTFQVRSRRSIFYAGY